MYYYPSTPEEVREALENGQGDLVSFDVNWWGHSIVKLTDSHAVTDVGIVHDNGKAIGVRFQNNWGPSWGNGSA